MTQPPVEPRQSTIRRRASRIENYGITVVTLIVACVLLLVGLRMLWSAARH